MRVIIFHLNTRTEETQISSPIMPLPAVEHPQKETEPKTLLSLLRRIYVVEFNYGSCWVLY